MRKWVATSLVLGALAIGSSPATARSEHYRDGGWDSRIWHDSFTGQTRCIMASTNRHLRYQPGAIGIRMGKHRNTLTAWYRVNNGAPVRRQDRSAALNGAGVAIDGPCLDNPTGGWIWIPLVEVEQAQSVAVRPDEHRGVRRFVLGRFAPMLEAARRLGCASDDAFRT